MAYEGIDYANAEYIYHEGARGAKELSLHRERDYKTGLSFTSVDYYTLPLKFSITKLRNAGYSVTYDGHQAAKELPFFGNQPFLYYDDVVILALDHYTVYHPENDIWDEWYKEDLANKHSPNISEHLLKLYSLREL